MNKRHDGFAAGTTARYNTLNRTGGLLGRRCTYCQTAVLDFSDNAMKRCLTRIGMKMPYVDLGDAANLARAIATDLSARGDQHSFGKRANYHTTPVPIITDTLTLL